MNSDLIRLSMIALAGLLVAVILFCTPGCADENTSSILDLTFNKPNGYALWQSPDAVQDRNLEMAVQADGKILLGGYTNDSSQKDIQIVRYLPSGTPDLLFGNAGHVTYSGGAGKDDYAFGIALDSNNSILVSGREHNGNDADILVLRYNSDGMKDTSFGNNGAVIYKGSGSGTDSGRGIVVQPDGNILVCGEVNVSDHKELIVLRYTPKGILDDGFGNAGVYTLQGSNITESNGYALALDKDGKILVTGSITKDGTEGIGLIRLTSEGSLDTTFGNGGITAWTGIEDGPDYGNWVSLTPEGKIQVTGVESDSSGSYDIVLLQFNQDGSLDTGFGTDGVAKYGYSGYNYAWGQTLMPDGKIIIAGTSQIGTLNTPILLRFNKNGTLDSTFGEDGVLSFENIGIGPLYAVHLDSEGRILSSGYITDNGVDVGLLLRLNKI